MDSIRSRYNIFITSIIFFPIWALWHVPLFFIKDSFQNSLLVSLPLTIFYFLNFLPITIITNYFFYKNNRSIPVAIIIHYMINISGELISLDYKTRIIQGVLWVLAALFLIFLDKKFFFKSKKFYL